nr:hypothetical protein [Leptospira kirschneri]
MSASLNQESRLGSCAPYRGFRRGKCKSYRFFPNFYRAWILLV